MVVSFDSLDLLEPVRQGIDAAGFTACTPIQQQALPLALAGKDVAGQAQTGTGKTATFLITAFTRLLQHRPPVLPEPAPRTLVVAPTRELAVQILHDAEQLGRFTALSMQAVYGGIDYRKQRELLQQGCDILIGTPGRLIDYFKQHVYSLRRVEVLVIDEADRLFDMGFLPDIRRILRALPATRRQNLLYSATLPPAITTLAHELLHDPVTINVERPSAPAGGISHAVYPVAGELKVRLLVELLRQPGVRSTLVFTRTKHRANRLADGLARRGVAAERIHGNRTQAQRTQALAAFKAGTFRVLVATDIAARGIDVEGISHVVNFDVPNLPDDYIHRVGRTARAGAVGDAITFVSPPEEADLRSIERAVGARMARVKLSGFDYVAREAERLEAPLAERIALIRARKAEERGRARTNAARRTVHRRAAAGRTTS